MDAKLLRALDWIKNLLETQNIPYQITGGLAAYLHGSDRKIADIDLDIPEKEMEKLLPYIKKYIVFGPAQYKDENWDLKLITLDYEGQEIDLGGAYKSKVFNQSAGTWDLVHVDFNTSKTMKIDSMYLPVVDLEHLIEYKKKLAREVDLIDLKAIAK